MQDALDETQRSNETISTIAKSYSAIYHVDLETDTYERISGSDIIPKTGCASEKMFDVCEQEIAPEYRNIIHIYSIISNKSQAKFLCLHTYIFDFTMRCTYKFIAL